MYRITGCKPGMWSFFILSAFISPCAQSISDKKTRTALRFPLLPLEYRLVINIFFLYFFPLESISPPKYIQKLLMFSGVGRGDTYLYVSELLIGPVPSDNLEEKT